MRIKIVLDFKITTSQNMFFLKAFFGTKDAICLPLSLTSVTLTAVKGVCVTRVISASCQASK